MKDNEAEGGLLGENVWKGRDWRIAKRRKSMKKKKPSNKGRA